MDTNFNACLQNTETDKIQQQITPGEEKDEFI